jgi:carbonic anhydrase
LTSPETDCSALKFDRQLVRDIITQNDPNAPGGPFKEGALTWAESLPILAITEGGTERERLERSVRDDVRFLREHPLWKPKMAVTGWIYDLHTRLAERVDG